MTQRKRVLEILYNFIMYIQPVVSSYNRATYQNDSLPAVRRTARQTTRRTGRGLARSLGPACCDGPSVTTLGPPPGPGADPSRRPTYPERRTSFPSSARHQRARPAAAAAVSSYTAGSFAGISGMARRRQPLNARASLGCRC